MFFRLLSIRILLSFSHFAWLFFSFEFSYRKCRKIRARYVNRKRIEAERIIQWPHGLISNVRCPSVDILHRYVLRRLNQRTYVIRTFKPGHQCRVSFFNWTSFFSLFFSFRFLFFFFFVRFVRFVHQSSSCGCWVRKRHRWPQASFRISTKFSTNYNKCFTHS